MNVFNNNKQNILNIFLKKITLINVLIIFFIFLLAFAIINNNKPKEGFSINDVNKVFNQIDDVVDLTSKLPNQIESIDNKLTGKVTQLGDQINDNVQKMGQEIEKNTLDKMEQLGKEIEKNTIDIFTNKLTSIFIQLGDMFNEGIIEPIMNLFIGIGNIFVQIFGILQEIGNKIVQLPNCIFTYAIKSTIDTLNYIYNSIIPKVIRTPLSFIYKYTLGIIFDFLANITGYNASVQKCYGFDVNTEIDKINSNLNDINSSFKDNFGDINFSKIKI